jgi:hypothetical protein
MRALCLFYGRDLVLGFPSRRYGFMGSVKGVKVVV